jgi:hypothetical protein
MATRCIRTDGFVEPCIPTRALKPPVGSDWVHEIKHDGYRLIVRRDEQFCTDNPKSKPLSLPVEIGTIHSEWVGIT